MDRLTRWNYETEGAELIEYDTEEWKELTSSKSMDILDWLNIHNAIEKLAEYEDTNLESDKIRVRMSNINDVLKRNKNLRKEMLELCEENERLNLQISAMLLGISEPIYNIKKG